MAATGRNGRLARGTAGNSAPPLLQAMPIRAKRRKDPQSPGKGGRRHVAARPRASALQKQRKTIR